MIYTLTFVKGVKTIVEKELQQKLENNYRIIESSTTSTTLESDIQDIDAFRVLQSVLHVSLMEGDKVLVERNLFRRSWRKHLVPAGVNPTIAYAMCYVANLQKEDIVMDPFCGGGTIPITALIDFNVKKVLASDISSKAIEFTKKNLVEAKITKDKYSIFISDVSRLRIQKNYLSKIVTNMPFGIRAGKHTSNINIYKSFINFSYNSLKEGGLLVVLTTEKNLLLENIANKFSVKEELKIEQGGLKPSVYLLTR